MRNPRAVFMLLALVVASIRPAAADVRTHDVRIGASSIHVTLDGTARVLTDDAILGWVEGSARAVAGYAGRFPVPETRLAIRIDARRRAVSGGVTYGGRLPSIRITVGENAREADLRDDWVLVHEMMHLAFPNLTSDDAWAEEGLSTYAEPLARVRAGTLSTERMWRELIDGLPKGVPAPSAPGLHGTEDWGRTYWGGGLFWLLADIGLRESSSGRLGLRDAVRAILDAGGDIRARWTLERTLRTADEALGVTVLRDLYAEHGAKRGGVDLDVLGQRLGIRRSGRTVAYDESGPLAAIRHAIGEGR